MAVREQHQVVKEFNAAADLSAKQYYFVELGSGTVNVTDAITDVPVGVLQNKPDAAGKHAEVAMFGFTKVVAGGAISAGALIGCTTAGKAVALTIGTDTTTYVLGRALTAATADGQVISATVDCMAPTRAA